MLNRDVRIAFLYSVLYECPANINYFVFYLYDDFMPPFKVRFFYLSFTYFIEQIGSYDRYDEQVGR